LFPAFQKLATTGINRKAVTAKNKACSAFASGWRALGVAIAPIPDIPKHDATLDLHEGDDSCKCQATDAMRPPSRLPSGRAADSQTLFLNPMLARVVSDEINKTMLRRLSTMCARNASMATQPPEVVKKPLALFVAALQLPERLLNVIHLSPTFTTH
jgi:hypothetical protein